MSPERWEESNPRWWVDQCVTQCTNELHNQCNVNKNTDILTHWFFRGLCYSKCANLFKSDIEGNSESYFDPTADAIAKIVGRIFDYIGGCPHPYRRQIPERTTEPVQEPPPALCSGAVEQDWLDWGVMGALGALAYTGGLLLVTEGASLVGAIGETVTTTSAYAARATLSGVSGIATWYWRDVWGL